MMGARMILTVGWFALAASILQACDQPDLNGCTVIEQDGDKSGLTYEGFVPGNCPIEVTVPASIYDPAVLNVKKVGANLNRLLKNS